MAARENKTETVRFRLSFEENEKLLQLCKDLGVSKSEFMRLCINYFDNTQNKNMFLRADLDSRRTLKDLSNQLSRLGNNLNQTTHFINSVKRNPKRDFNAQDIADISDSLYAFTEQFISLCKTYNTNIKINYKKIKK